MIQACQHWESTSGTSRLRELEDVLHADNPPATVDAIVSSEPTETSRAAFNMDAGGILTQIEKQYILFRATNCALIMSTVQGGYAHRGKFVTAFSEQLRLSNGDTNILEMFSAASNAVEKDAEVKYQVPECRTTLRKTLRL